MRAARHAQARGIVARTETDPTMTWQSTLLDVVFELTRTVDAPAPTVANLAQELVVSGRVTLTGNFAGRAPLFTQ